MANRRSVRRLGKRVTTEARMTREDMRMYETVFPRWRDVVTGGQSDREPKLRIVLLSCSKEQTHLIKRLFPRSRLMKLTVDAYNLNDPLKRDVEVIAAMNVFHYSDNPLLWFSNILPFCRYAWIQDLINRKRLENSELGADGDRTRYCYTKRGIVSDFPGAFDLSILDERVVDFCVYEGGTTGAGVRDTKHFLMCLRGDRQSLGSPADPAHETERIGI